MRDTTLAPGRAYCLRESPSTGSTAGRGIGTGRRPWRGLSATRNVRPCWPARCSPPCEPAELDEILKFASERRVRRGQTIFQRGDNGSSMMAVLRGRVRISSVSGDGKEVTLNVINPGEIIRRARPARRQTAQRRWRPRSRTRCCWSWSGATSCRSCGRTRTCPCGCCGAVQTAAPDQHGAGGDRAVRSAGPPGPRAAEARGGLRPAGPRRYAHRPEAVAARSQQPRRLVAREREQAVARVAGDAAWWTWRTASSCCAGRRAEAR